jgi:dihydroorotate dehydrogenase (NAD+) catalytic subunit
MPKYDLSLTPPIMNAAGFLGFAPAPRGGLDLPQLGAFVTNPVSLKRRTPAQGARFLPFPGGFLLHTGHPNPGLKQLIRHSARHWARSSLPLIVHLLAENTEEVAQMVKRLETVEGVRGIELGIPPEADLRMVIEMVEAAIGELPLIVRLPMERALELGKGIVQDDIFALSLAPPRGALPDTDGHLVHGRLYGPAIFPLALEITQKLASFGRPVFAAGGVHSPQDAQLLLSCGATAVQLDSVLWVPSALSDKSSQKY